MSRKEKFINREISWLSFNERVLQEANDNATPLIERIRFLGIFSNNRDEFFRVRVASLKRLAKLDKKALKDFDFNPKEVLEEIHEISLKQEKQFEIYFEKIIKELRKEGIYMVNELQLTEKQGEFVDEYFEDHVRPYLVPIMLGAKKKIPSLKDRVLYHAIKLHNNEFNEKPYYALIELPKSLPRFLVLPEEDNKKHIILLDDIVRHNLRSIFSLFDFDYIEAHTFKITRDAELEMDDDISMSLLEKMEKSIERRKEGKPVRFVYDSDMPTDVFRFIIKKLRLIDEENIIPGGRYHNFRDFIDFPTIGAENLRYNPFPQLNHPDIIKGKSIFQSIRERDILLCYPYQKFNYIVDLLREAAIDPKVTSIKINLYRVANDSKVINALVNAAKNGKIVTAIIELKARFDEENNIYWSNTLKDSGVRVIFGVPGLKVHSKLIFITRKEGKRNECFAHIGTGNFHEGTAKIYGDYSLLTYNEKITKEVEKVFEFFQNNYKRGIYRNLLISPFNTRRKFIALIDNEIDNSKKGIPSKIIIKLNNLLDDQLITKLYEASNAGVKINLIIRGICALIPGIKGMSENIEAISIVDKFLEHARVMVFENGGDELYFISSADWMVRNLDFRVEVTTPIYDKKLQKLIKKRLEIQLQDNVKARIIDKYQKNKYKKTRGEKVRSQIDTYDYFKTLLKE